MAGSELRDNLRSNVIACRERSRSEVLMGKRKTLEDLCVCRSVTSAEVKTIAKKLKMKSAVQVEDLGLLKLAFVQRSENRKIFLSIKDALHSLVRELTSSKSNYQLVAAECCCNLALGDLKDCRRISKAAGPYLIANLSGCNYNLTNASIWALSNLAGSGRLVCVILHAQGFVGKLLKLIEENDVPSDTQVKADIKQNSLNALSHVLRQWERLLLPKEVENIAKTVSNLEHYSWKDIMELQFLLSSTDSANEELLIDQVHTKCLHFLSQDEPLEESVMTFSSALRTIANLSADSSGVCAREIFENWDAFKDIIQKIICSPFTFLSYEASWLVGNLLNHSSAEVQGYVESLKSD